MMNQIPSQQHREAAPRRIRCAVVTVSDTRTLKNDRGGKTIMEHLLSQGHHVAQREIVPDDPDRVQHLVRGLAAEDAVDVILVTGGTGISPRDQTFEAIAPLLQKTLPGYGELFRLLSYQQIGAAAMLSRAEGGLVGQTVVLTMPGSPAAIDLAMQKLILPELGHLVQQACLGS
jgi:molybdenum cofactor biosynthesis protein B